MNTQGSGMENWIFQVVDWLSIEKREHFTKWSVLDNIIRWMYRYPHGYL